MIIGIDPASKDSISVAFVAKRVPVCPPSLWDSVSALGWMDSAQALNRLDRPHILPKVRNVGTAVTATARSDFEPKLSVKGLADMMSPITVLDDRIWDMTMLKNIPPLRSGFDPMISGRREEPNFVDAFWGAADRWGVDMSLRLPLPGFGKCPIDYLAAWIWGPNGEFTAFAKTDEFDTLISRFGASNGYSALVHHPFHKDVGFVVSLTARRYDPMTGSRYESCSHLVQFATYRDYVLWERYALRDEGTPTKGGRRGNPYR